MKRLLKRLLLCIAILLAALTATLGVATYYLNGNPSHYRTYAWTSAERSRINSDAVHKILDVQNKIAANHAAEIRKEPVTRPSIILILTQEEINAFLIHNFADELAPWIKDPGIYLKNGRIIFAGKPVGIGMDIVASAFFKPSVNADGTLGIELEKTLGGRLPLPDFIVESQTDKVLRKIDNSLPNFRKKANMDSLGRCNTSFVEASLAQSIQNILNHNPSSPILFFPNDNGASLPMRIVDIQVSEESLKLVIEIPTPQERETIRNGVLK